MNKIELIYDALSAKIPEDVDTFWDKCDRFGNAKDRTIDIDNLQGITIFLIWKLCQPIILIDCFLITEFASRSNFYSRRMGFVKYVQASLDYLLDLNLTDYEDPIEEIIDEDETTENIENMDHFSGITDIKKRVSRSISMGGEANFTKQRKFTEISSKKEKYGIAVSESLLGEDVEEDNLNRSKTIKHEELLFD